MPKIYTYSIRTFDVGQIVIGRQGENLATRIDVDVTPWKKEYPTGTISLFVAPPAGNGYLAAIEENGNTIRWTIRDTDTAYAGQGKAELILKDAIGTVMKSVTANTICVKSVSAEEPADPPEAIRPWVDQILEAIKSGGVSAEAIAAAVEAYIQEHGVHVEETDPTVPDWAKQPSKPTYTASEVGADAAGTASGSVAAHNTSGAAHADLRALIEGIVIPTALPNPQPITINGQRYDGSEAVTVTVSSEGVVTPVEIDDTLTQSGQAADAKAVGDQLSALNAAIDAKGDPTDEQVSSAVNAYLDANPVSGGIGTTATNLLIAILRSGVYTADQSDNITALETALGGGTTKPEEKTYAISNELINCTSSNSATSVKENAAYSATLTANDGYTLTGGTVTVKMGGVDITATAYEYGVISIAAVTGDVEIFASAIAVQAEAALPEDGLISYFDYRTATYNNAGSGGTTTIAPTKGSGQLYMWANNSISAQNEYGLKPANTRKWQYDQNGGTNETALGGAFTVIQLTYGEAPGFGFGSSSVGAFWVFYPKYINASGSAAYAAQANGGDFNSDNKSDYNFTVVRADGATLTEIFDTSRTIYNGGDIDGFSRWLDTPYGNITDVRNNASCCTAMAIYNRALTDSEIEAAREFMKTLEVTA